MIFYKYILKKVPRFKIFLNNSYIILLFVNFTTLPFSAKRQKGCPVTLTERGCNEGWLFVKVKTSQWYNYTVGLARHLSVLLVQGLRYNCRKLFCKERPPQNFVSKITQRKSTFGGLGFSFLSKQNHAANIKRCQTSFRHRRHTGTNNCYI
jgi:hypothetical protein